MHGSLPGRPVVPGPRSLDAALLRVRDGRGHGVGVAFMVSDILALTCAHVVQAALGTTSDEAPDAAARVQVDLPLVPAPHRDAGPPVTTARVEHWVPPRAPAKGPSVPAARTESRPGRAGAVLPADVAVLRLEAPLPGARPVQLVESDALWGHPLRAYGLPVGRPGGVWHAGVLRGRQADGWVQADLAGDGYPVSRGFSGGPVWDDRLSGVVGMVTVAEAGEPPVSYLVPTSGLLAVCPALRTVALPPSPFRGLSAFGEADAALFHGRQAESEEVARALSTERRVTVVGPSGSGKSSLALAGVVPLLRAQGAQVVVVRPTRGSTPFASFAAGLLPLLEPGLPEAERQERTAELAEVLRRHGPADTVTRLLHLRRGSRLLLVVDQFEEVLSLGPAVVDDFADLLTGGALPASVRVLMTLRADFLEPVLAHPRLGPAAGEHLYALAPPDPARLREMVTAPVDAVPGVSYEPQLAERIIADTGPGPGELPLLGLTLDLLWQQQEGGLLTHRAYEQLGGVSGALGRHAEEEWDECVPPEDEEVARRLFTRLVQVTAGLPAPARRTALRTELGAGEWRVAQRLASTRLLVTGRNAEGVETVELAHEALITGWGKLSDWAGGDRAFLEWRAELQQDLRRWEEAGQPPQLLPTSLQLARSDEWLSRRGAELAEAERRYLKAGHARRRATVRRRRAKAALITLVVLLVVVALSTFYATRVESQKRAAEAASRALAVAAADDSGTEPALGALKALAAHRTAPTQEARDELLRQYLQYEGYDRVLSGVLGTVREFEVSADGDVVLAVSRPGRATLFTGVASGRVRSAQVPATGQVMHGVVAEDGKRVAYVQADGKAVWFDVDTDAAGLLGPKRRLGGEAGVRLDPDVVPAISADGRSMASVVGDRFVRWDLESGARTGDAPVLPDLTGPLAFAPDGRGLLAMTYGESAAQGLTSVDMSTGRAKRLFSGTQEIHLSGDRTTAVACRLEGGQSVIRRYRTADGTETGRSYRERERAYTTDMCTLEAVDEAGRRVALRWGDEVRVLDLDKGEAISRAPLPGVVSTQIRSHGRLAESHGKLYHVGWNDSLITFMDMTPGRRLLKAGQHRLTPDGQRSLIVQEDGSRTALHPAAPGRSGRVLAQATRAEPYWVPERTDLPVFDATGALVADREGRNLVVVRDASTLRKVTTVRAVRPPPTVPGTRVARDLDMSGGLSNYRQNYEFRYFFDHTGHVLTVSGTVVQQWDPRTGRQTARFDAGALRPDDEPDAVMTIAPYPARNKVSVLVLGSPGLRIVDLTTGKVTDRVRTEDDTLSVQFSPDGAYFAVLRRDTGLEVRRRGDHPRLVLGPLSTLGEEDAGNRYRAVFLDDGRFLVAADNAVRTYRLDEPGHEDSYVLGAPVGGADEYLLLDVSGDGRSVVHGAFEEPGTALALDPRVWSRELCRIIGHRAFTADEREGLPAGSESRRLCP